MRPDDPRKLGKLTHFSWKIMEKRRAARKVPAAAVTKSRQWNGWNEYSFRKTSREIGVKPA